MCDVNIESMKLHVPVLEPGCTTATISIVQWRRTAAKGSKALPQDAQMHLACFDCHTRARLQVICF